MKISALVLLLTISVYVRAQKPLTYLALGDSYTIGQSVAQKDCFPYQLSLLLTKQHIPTAKPKIIARTGWTTDELQVAIRKEKLNGKFDFVTLLIGVNNQFRDYPENIYRKEFAQLLTTAINFTGGRKDHVFVVSIPDWGATPYADGTDRTAIGKKIDRFNAIGRAEALKAGINYTDITPGSRNVLKDNELIAADGLHPSAKMYATWARALAPKIAACFK